MKKDQSAAAVFISTLVSSLGLPIAMAIADARHIRLDRGLLRYLIHPRTLLLIPRTKFRIGMLVIFVVWKVIQAILVARDATSNGDDEQAQPQLEPEEAQQP